jgi:hypothetical protein
MSVHAGPIDRVTVTRVHRGACDAALNQNRANHANEAVAYSARHLLVTLTAVDLNRLAENLTRLRLGRRPCRADQHMHEQQTAQSLGQDDPEPATTKVRNSFLSA